MDIENLNKSQIVLLTLLVSFVTSIATGIVTVTLLAQAPPAVTQTINRVVERTVERVVPAETQGTNTVVTEKTTVVKESDLITESIENNAQSLVRIVRKGEGGSTDTLAGIGFFVSRGGVIATGSSLVVGDGTYTITTSDGTPFSTNILDTGEGQPTALLRVIISEDEDSTFTPVTFVSDERVLKLGQTVISLSGDARTNVALGIVAALDTVEREGEEGTETVLRNISTDINQSRLLPGSPLINLFGEVVGVHTARAQGSDATANFTPIATVESQLGQFVEAAAQ